jgi:hypothetical protein
MVQDNFGVYGGRETYEAAWRYYLAEDEEAAVSILDHLGVRYVVADARGPGMPGRLPEASMASRLNDAYGSETRLADGRVLPALSRHRLVFHAHTDRAGHRGGPLAAQAPHASLGVWERVEGARVQGSAPPNARVTATLDLSTPTGRRHRYRAGTRATAEGRYSLILPYPNERFFGTAVRAADHYLIETDGASAPVFVTEEAVVGGRTVEGPAL